jgi:hypothetical protein
MQYLVFFQNAQFCSAQFQSNWLLTVIIFLWNVHILQFRFQFQIQATYFLENMSSTYNHYSYSCLSLDEMQNWVQAQTGGPCGGVRQWWRRGTGAQRPRPQPLAGPRGVSAGSIPCLSIIDGQTALERVKNMPKQWPGKNATLISPALHCTSLHCTDELSSTMQRISYKGSGQGRDN